MLSVMRGQNPRDHFELMLIIQTVGLNDLVMKYIGLLGRADRAIEIDVIERTLNKLARTFATQLEVLQRCRSGEPKVTLQQNVSVSGGQAIVGTVNQNHREVSKANDAMIPPAIVDARSTPMPIIEGNEEPVTVSAKRKSRQ